MSRKFNVAVVGCGAIAQGMHLRNVKRHPEINLRWCCDVDPKAFQRADRGRRAVSLQGATDRPSRQR